MRKCFYLLVLFAVLFSLLPQAAHAQTASPDYLDGSIYLKLQDTTSLNLDPYPGNLPVLDLILTTFGVDSIYRPFRSGHPALQNIYRLEFTNVLGVSNLISQLELLSFVDYAERVPLNVTVGGAVLTPNDLQLNQWGLPKIQAELAWGITQGNPNVKVAIVDNAERITHEDLSGVIWTNPNETPNNFWDDDLNGYTDDVNGYDVADLDGDVNPPSGVAGWDHGSHCSGVAGAATNNGIGIASIGYGISIIPVKATNNLSGGNTLTKAFEGVDYARAAGADVISMSWGSNGTSATGNLILSLAQSQGILLVAAAGNNGDSVPFYPAAYSQCLAVGSTDQFDIRSPFSNYGSYVDVMAPGSDIVSCLAGADDQYGTMSGTSMACPLVAGLAGLIWSAAPSLTRQQVRDAIIAGCVNIDGLNPGFEGKLGAGRINAFNSLLLAGMAAPAHPDAAITLFPNPAHGQVHVAFPEAWLHDWVTVEVYDVAGAHRHTQRLDSGNALLDVSGLVAGMYWLRFSQGERSAMEKLCVR